MRTNLLELKHSAEAKDVYGVKSTRAWNDYRRALDAARTPFERGLRRWAGWTAVALGSAVLWAVMLSPIWRFFV